MARLYRMIRTVDDIERISDHAENIIEYEEKIREGKARISPVAMDELRELSDLPMRSVELSLMIFDQEKTERLPEADDIEEQVDRKKEEIINNHLVRLVTEGCDPQGGLIFTDLSVDLERCSDHALNIAYSMAGNEA